MADEKKWKVAYALNGIPENATFAEEAIEAESCDVNSDGDLVFATGGQSVAIYNSNVWVRVRQVE